MTQSLAEGLPRLSSLWSSPVAARKFTFFATIQLLETLYLLIGFDQMGSRPLHLERPRTSLVPDLGAWPSLRRSIPCYDHHLLLAMYQSPASASASTILIGCIFGTYQDN